MKSTDFAALLSRYFTRYLPNERGSSPQTIDTYRNAFILYLEYMESVCGIKPEKMSIKDYTRESILGFLKWLEQERGNSTTTRNYRLAAMIGFVHYLKYEFPDFMEEYQQILGIPIKKTEQKSISYMKTEVQLINVNKKFKKYRLYFRTKKGRTYPLVKISCFKKDIDSGNSVFYAASSHLAALYCFMCSCGVMISKGLLSLSMANIMLHTLCETAPIATSLGFDSHFLR